MNQRVSVANLADTIIEELEKYNDEVTEEIKKEVKEVSKSAVKDLKRLSPQRTGDYRTGWKYKVAYQSKDDIRITIYNAKKPQLTHLLEFGHAKVSGGRVEGITHISTAMDSAEKKLVSKIKVRIK